MSKIEQNTTALQELLEAVNNLPSSDIAALLDRTIRSIDDSSVTTVKSYACYKGDYLTSVNLPNVTRIEEYAFAYCLRLEILNISNVTFIGNNAFTYCKTLTSLNLPNVANVGSYTFDNCLELANVYLGNVGTIGRDAFAWCSKLTSVTLRSNTVCSLYNSNAFDGCHEDLRIYVPANLVSAYKTATNWSVLADRIVGIS